MARESEVKEDEYGQYREDAGSPHPVEEDEVGYIPCNAVLKHTWERYGERRYCTGMAVKNFSQHEHTETSYDEDDFCKHHQSRAALMKQHEDQFKTGAYAKSHEHIFQHLPPHKQIMANDLYKSLVSESVYDFEMEQIELEVDVSDSDFAPDADTLVLDHPIPSEKQMRARALWFAALDFMSMESIREEQFRVAAEETHEGDSLAIGERTTVVAVTDEGRVIEDKEEHHLNLPLSRLQTDYQKHLKFGGVEYETESEDTGMDVREYVLEIEPDEEEIQPESKSADSSPLTSLDEPDED